jgi:uncharacterized protein (TIGR03083 family)
LILLATSGGWRYKKWDSLNVADARNEEHIMQPPQPVITVALFPEERERLVDLLTTLTPEQWDKPTICPGWSVKDIAAHLLGDDLGKLSRQRDGYFATAPAPGEDIIALVNRINGEWVQATRRLSPRLLCELLEMSGRSLFPIFAGMDLFALGEAVSWVGPDPAPVWLDIAREYTERWLHQQQIRDALGVAGLTEPHFFAPVLATFVWALPKTYAAVDKPDGTRIQVQITGASGGIWTVVREGEKWALYEGSATQPTSTVTMDQDVAWRLFTKGIAPDIAEQSVQIDGDYQLGRIALSTVSIIA